MYLVLYCFIVRISKVNNILLLYKTHISLLQRNEGILQDSYLILRAWMRQVWICWCCLLCLLNWYTLCDQIQANLWCCILIHPFVIYLKNCGFCFHFCFWQCILCKFLRYQIIVLEQCFSRYMLWDILSDIVLACMKTVNNLYINEYF